MVGGGSSELRSLRSNVDRALEVCGNLGYDLGALEQTVGRLESEVASLAAELAELRAGSAQPAQPEKQAKPAKPAPRSAAKRRAKAK